MAAPRVPYRPGRISERVQPGQVAPDDQLLDFGGAVRDRHDLGIAEVPFDGKLFGDTVAAVDLHGLAGDFDCHFSRIPFRHRGLRVAAHAQFQKLQPTLAQQARSIQMRGHVG